MSKSKNLESRIPAFSPSPIHSTSAEILERIQHNIFGLVTFFDLLSIKNDRQWYVKKKKKRLKKAYETKIKFFHNALNIGQSDRRDSVNTERTFGFHKRNAGRWSSHILSTKNHLTTAVNNTNDDDGLTLLFGRVPGYNTFFFFCRKNALQDLQV